MTIPFWTLLVAVFLPFVWFTVEALSRRKTADGLDANHPRLQEANLKGLAARAHGATCNAFEAITLYVPAVITAHLFAPDSKLAPTLALVWVAARVLHGVVYLANIPPARTALFSVGMISVLGLFLIGGHVL